MNRQTFGLCMLVALVTAGGCNEYDWKLAGKGPISRDPQLVPRPIDLMLPKSILVHPFTGRTFDEAGGIRGIDVNIKAVDFYGDETKAFGDFRFEMYEHRPNSLDPKGNQIASWDEALLEPKKNLLHWDKLTRMYIFKLQWDRPIPIGKRVVLVVTFSSPFTSRLTAERVFISGQ